MPSASVIVALYLVMGLLILLLIPTIRTTDIVDNLYSNSIGDIEIGDSINYKTK